MFGNDYSDVRDWTRHDEEGNCEGRLGKSYDTQLKYQVLFFSFFISGCDEAKMHGLGIVYACAHTCYQSSFLQVLPIIRLNIDKQKYF